MRSPAVGSPSSPAAWREWNWIPDYRWPGDKASARHDYERRQYAPSSTGGCAGRKVRCPHRSACPSSACRKTTALRAYRNPTEQGSAHQRGRPRVHVRGCSRAASESRRLAQPAWKRLPTEDSTALPAAQKPWPQRIARRPAFAARSCAQCGVGLRDRFRGWWHWQVPIRCWLR